MSHPIAYPYLPSGRAFIYVSENDPFMAAAKQVCLELSTEKNQPTGAVLVRNGRIIAQAANQVAIKNEYIRDLHKRGWCIRHMLGVKTGTKYWVCPGCSGYSLHAEARVIADAKRKGVSTEGADIYLYGHWWCCKPCWDRMIEAGIKDVYLLEGSEGMFHGSRK